MNKFVNFDTAVKAAFENDESMYMDFSKLMNDVMHNELDGITVKQANDKIVEMFHKVLGTNSASSKVEIRKAIRRNQIALYEIIEEIVDNALVSGWEQNPFFKEYVDGLGYFGAAAEYSYHTIFGPITLNVHWSNMTRKAGFYLSAGYNF